jgi:UDP-N-acetylmuramyl pentapeptide synthase
MNFITGWCIGRMKELGLENQANNDWLEWAHISALITAVTIGGLNFYEVLEIISSKNQSAYWSNTNSYVDILAQGAVEFSSILIISTDTLKDEMVDAYVIGLVLQSCKFYIN